MVRARQVVLALGLAVGCGGSVVDTEDAGDGTAPSGGTNGTSKPPAVTPTKKCEAYASAWCEKSFGCFVKNGRLAKSVLQSNIDQCRKLIIEKLPCSGVRAVSSTYDQCLADVKALSCTKFNVAPESFTSIPQPVSCDDVVSF